MVELSGITGQLCDLREYRSMLHRLLLILVVAWQPLVLWGAITPARPKAEYAAMSCCEAVQESPCCSKPDVQLLKKCGMSDGGRCLCGMSPSDAPGPAPEAPLPRGDRDSLTAVPALTPHFVRYPDVSARHRLPSALDSGLLSTKTNNEVQAFLGVWRT